MKKPKKVIVFENPILEAFTHVDPLTPLMLWGPVAILMLAVSYMSFDLGFLTYINILFWAFLSWSVVEYFLHRFAFHFPAKTDFSKRMVFIFHGLHHDDPSDKTRLLMPPLPAFLYLSLLVCLFYMIWGEQQYLAFSAFFLIFYLIYDYIHFATHHFVPKTKIGKFLRKHHLQHHVLDGCKFGVTSPLMDIIFRTYNRPK